MITDRNYEEYTVEYIDEYIDECTDECLDEYTEEYTEEYMEEYMKKFMSDELDYGNAPRNPHLTDEEFEENKEYFKEQISIYGEKVAKALGRKHVTKLKHYMDSCCTRDEMAFWGTEEWKQYIDLMLHLYADASILAQYKFSSKAFRSNLTLEVMREKCSILGLDEESTYDSLCLCGFDVPKPDSVIQREKRQNKYRNIAGKNHLSVTAQI